MTAEDLTASLARLTSKQNRIQNSPPLPPASIDSLFDDFALRHAHETTALEGNTLTLHEAQEVIEQGTTIPGKSLREHLEVVNAYATWQWLRRVVERHEPLTAALVLELHRRLMQGILGDDAGFYRCMAVYIRGLSPRPSNLGQGTRLDGAMGRHLFR
jgi:Fic family protein